MEYIVLGWFLRHEVDDGLRGEDEGENPEDGGYDSNPDDPDPVSAQISLILTLVLTIS